MAAPAFGAIGTQLQGTGATAPMAAPASIAVGDILRATLFLDTGAASVTALPSGWAHATDSPQHASNHHLYVMWKRADAGDVSAGTFTFTLSASVYRQGAVERYTGAIDTGDPWDVTNGLTNETSLTTTPDVADSTTVADTLLCWSATNWSGGTWTPPSGFTERRDSGDGTSTSADKVQAAAGSTGAIVGTCTGSDKRCAWVGALKPAGAAAPAGDSSFYAPMRAFPGRIGTDKRFYFLPRRVPDIGGFNPTSGEVYYVTNPTDATLDDAAARHYGLSRDGMIALFDPAGPRTTDAFCLAWWGKTYANCRYEILALERMLQFERQASVLADPDGGGYPLTYLGGDCTDSCLSTNASPPNSRYWVGSDFSVAGTGAIDLVTNRHNVNALPLRNHLTQEFVHGATDASGQMRTADALGAGYRSMLGDRATAYAPNQTSYPSTIYWCLAIRDNTAASRVLHIGAWLVKNPGGGGSLDHDLLDTHILGINVFGTVSETGTFDVGSGGKFYVGGFMEDTTYLHVWGREYQPGFGPYTPSHWENVATDTTYTTLARVPNAVDPTATAHAGTVFTNYEWWTGSAWSNNLALAARLKDTNGNDITGDAGIAKVATGHYMLVAQRYEENVKRIYFAPVPQGPYVLYASVSTPIFGADIPSAGVNRIGLHHRIYPTWPAPAGQAMTMSAVMGFPAAARIGRHINEVDTPYFITVPIEKPLYGSLDAVAEVAGDLTVTAGGAQKLLDGAVEAVAEVAGVLSVGKSLAAAVEGVVEVAGALVRDRTVAGAVEGVAALAGDVVRTRELTAAVPAVAEIAGILSIAVALVGDVSAVVEIAGDLSVAVGVADLPASVTLTAVVDTPTPGPVTVADSSASVTLTAVVDTPTPGLVTATDTAGTITLQPVPATAAPSPIFVAASIGTFTLNPVQTTPVPGRVTVAASPGVFSLAPVGVTPTPGSVTVAGVAGTLTLSPVADTPGVGSTTVAATTGVLTLTPLTVTPTPGPVTTADTSAAMTLAAVVDTPTPGPVSTALTTGAFTLTPRTVTPSVGGTTVADIAASVTLAAVAATTTPGPVSVVATVGALTLTPQTVGFTYGPVTVADTPATLNLAAVAATLLGAGVDITGVLTLQPVAVTNWTFGPVTFGPVTPGALTLQPVVDTPVPGPITTAITRGAFTLMPRTVTPTPGASVVAVATGALTLTPRTLTPVVGRTFTPITTGQFVLQPVPLSAAGAVPVTPGTLTLAAVVDTPMPGMVTTVVVAGTITLSPVSITPTPGAATVADASGTLTVAAVPVVMRSYVAAATGTFILVPNVTLIPGAIVVELIWVGLLTRHWTSGQFSATSLWTSGQFMSATGSGQFESSEDSSEFVPSSLWWSLHPFTRG